ncbi:hypothetical protein BZA05DRAFT_394671 [Tricharina praecox]|uniref:uncharacterized protein n=1 Tax=Tricharina praecox TaxID=43433 RepID=UPI0022211BF9|nr:uncharacterized protein BZA05DRAFT_394671 [Tricharina praecox]KAI5853778.1 hypothetical protein BZA05DRAFT_394671 [Tricharina praecox]
MMLMLLMLMLMLMIGSTSDTTSQPALQSLSRRHRTGVQSVSLSCRDSRVESGVGVWVLYGGCLYLSGRRMQWRRLRRRI